MAYKQLSIDVKDLDDNKGMVKAYANVYDYEDSDGDISAKGSFTKTVEPLLGVCSSRIKGKIY